MLERHPIPAEDEHPASYADRLGRWYARSVSDGHKKELGQYLTPVEVARFMAKSFRLPDGGALRVLDLGAGAGILSCALCEAIAEHANRRVDLELEAFRDQAPAQQ